MKRVMKWIWVPVLLLAGAGSPSWAQVGTETCLQCHEEVGTAIAYTPHVQKNGVSCEACHGNGEAHADDPSPDNIQGFRTVTARQVLDTCRQCHTDKHPLLSSHLTTGTACLNCHNLGHSEAYQDHKKQANEHLVKATNSELCTTCHAAERAMINRPYRHPSDDFENLCLSCHNPHTTRADLDRREVEKRCATCHPENAGPFMFVHAATDRDGCTACHEPHGSTNANLLTRSTTRVLCLSCHTDTPAFHNQADPRYRQCTACHRAIHGSNLNKLFKE